MYIGVLVGVGVHVLHGVSLGGCRSVSYMEVVLVGVGVHVLHGVLAAGG